MYNYMHFQGLGPFGAESVSGSAFGRDLACIWADLGADWGTHWEPGPLFQRLGATFVACRFLVFFGRFPGLVKISSRAKVDGN